jgi:hypothetical protein
MALADIACRTLRVAFAATVFTAGFTVDATGASSLRLLALNRRTNIDTSPWRWLIFATTGDYHAGTQYPQPSLYCFHRKLSPTF